MSLSSYYDEVALKGLELAARDLARGVLTRPQVERIKEAVTTLVTELAEYDDVDPGTAPLAKASPDRSATQDLPKHPAPDGAMPESLKLPAKWRDEKPIQCVAGRGPLDDATAAILAQLLEKHGLGAEIVAHEAVSRNAIGGFRREGVPMVCVCYLDMSGHASPLRFLLKRLRQRVGDARLLVALWPSDHPVMSDQKLRAVLSADEYVTSLRDVVNACLKAAQDAATAYKRRATTTGGNDRRPPEFSALDGGARADRRARWVEQLMSQAARILAPGSRRFLPASEAILSRSAIGQRSKSNCGFSNPSVVALNAPKTNRSATELIMGNSRRATETRAY
jgi:hypothetical protein